MEERLAKIRVRGDREREANCKGQLVDERGVRIRGEKKDRKQTTKVTKRQKADREEWKMKKYRARERRLTQMRGRIRVEEKREECRIQTMGLGRCCVMCQKNRGGAFNHLLGIQ